MGLKTDASPFLLLLASNCSPNWDLFPATATREAPWSLEIQVTQGSCCQEKETGPSNYNERCWSSSPSVTWMLLHISVLFLSSPGFLSHTQCWFWSHPGVQTNLRAGPVLQRGLEKIPLSKGGWCSHFPGSRGRRSWGWSSRAPGGQQLCKRGKFIPLYRWEERSIARVSVFLCVLRSPQFTPRDSLCPCVLPEQNWEKGENGLFFVLGFWSLGAISFLLWVLVLWENSYVSW